MTDHLRAVADDDHASHRDAHQANTPHVGAGTPDTAPWEHVQVPWLRRQPVLALALLALVPTLTALVTELTARATDPLLVTALGAATTLITIGAAVVRANVTPTARPRLAPDLPLTPPGDLGS